MKPRNLFPLIFLFGLQHLGAQNVPQEPEPDPVLEAIREFNERRQDDPEKPNEVTVVLDPVGEPPVQPDPEPPGEEMEPAEDGEVSEPVAEESAPEESAVEEAPDESSDAAVLVTGKPPQDAQLLTTPDEADDDSGSGLTVRIEKLKSVPGRIDPAKVKLLAPFPAKPLSQPGNGWLLDAPEDIPPFTRQVELAPGSKITLTIRPHVLIPEANGSTVFSVVEPGFNNSLGYQQTDTVGAILADSVEGLEQDSKRMGLAIERLQQLLISLPKPEIEEKPPTLNKP